MKKLFAFLLLAWACLAQAQLPPYGLQMYQASSDGTYYVGRWFPSSPSTTSYMLTYDGNTGLPVPGYIGAGLSWNGTTLSAAGLNPSQSAQTRSLNTAFQVSSTRPALVTYSVQLTVTPSFSYRLGQEVLL